MPGAPAPASLGVARAIAASLLAGVTSFALIAWIIGRQSPISADDPATGTLFLYAWTALALAAVVAALIVWRANVAPRIERARPRHPAAPEQDAAADAEALQSGLIITWALIEAPALFGIVVYLLYGYTSAYAAGLLLAWLGIGLTWPRSDWFPSNA